ncbi:MULTISPECIES: DUF6221 family protein [unclassified Streptomyces]|uniref:DUF6221 family protein n=1 Tax=unclassified Streptomyces TaxID=2593676 RepID=UPI0036E4E5C8
MDDLVQWLRAQLDEDERIARHAAAGPWARHVGYISGGPEHRVRVAQQAQAWNADHIVSHDPARVLAGIDAKRQLLDEFTQTGSQPDTPEWRASPNWKGEFGYLQGLARAVHILASAYADRPGYREDWRP